MADWGGEECEGDKVQPEHRVGEKSQLDDTLIVFFFRLFFSQEIYRNHCSYILRMILSSNAWQLEVLGLNITERPDTVLLTILSSTCTFSINTDGRNTERAHLGQHRVWASG